MIYHLENSGDGYSTLSFSLPLHQLIYPERWLIVGVGANFPSKAILRVLSTALVSVIVDRIPIEGNFTMPTFFESVDRDDLKIDIQKDPNSKGVFHVYISAFPSRIRLVRPVEPPT